MKMFLGTIIAAALMVSPARAADATPPDSITIDQAIGVMRALGQLDRYEVQDKDGKAVSIPYKFSGALRYLIASDLDLATTAARQYQTAVNALVMQISGGGNKVPDELLPKFNEENNKLLAAPAGVILRKIKLDDLKLDENPIPVSVLSVLMPIIEK